jgi:pimeloyl-ACP methyl ester carboxylesterase
MQVIERGNGEPLVLIPGVQGRWEYMSRTIDALAEFYRVLTFPLCDEPSARAAFDRDHVIDSFATQVEQVLDNRDIARAAICGASFGGIVALRVAARTPARVSALVMASTPGPHWHLRTRHKFYTRLPWLFGPVFAAESPWRLRREINVALPDNADRRRFRGEQARALMRAPLSFSRMAVRARSIELHDRRADCAQVSCPTLIIHGDPALDHVVNAGGTSEYVQLIRGARVAVMEQTGHLGCITRPHEFAAIVRTFLSAAQQDSHHSAA